MIRSRAYAGEADYQRVHDLLVESYALTGTTQNWTIDCWDWFRYNGHVFEEIDGSHRWQSDVRLWQTERRKLVGAAILDDRDLFLQVHPYFRRIEGEMLDWAERHDQEGCPGGVDNAPLSIYVFEHDQQRQALLRGRGYRNLGHESNIRARSLDPPLPTFGLPPGYFIRSLDGQDREDLAKRAAVANAAFGITKHRAETIQVLQRAPSYDPELDLVVVAPDASFAAYCVLWVDGANRIGMFGPVGTHPAHQRRGLGRAMMCEGLRRLQALRTRTAYVDCDAGGVADRLYQAVGFRQCDRLHHWQKAGR